MKLRSLLFIVFTTAVYSQEFSKAIEDNSFFIEEAYNQEERVVQHIFTGATFSRTGGSESGFTQEWPAFGLMHQLSFSVPFIVSSLPSAQGIGDVMVNYRYQMIRDNSLAFSPRFSVILPTGDEAKGFGSGVVGAQVNLPLSKRFTNEFVTHYNGGMTLLPNVTMGLKKETVTDYFVGASGIYLLREDLNIMIEALFNSSGSASGRTEEFILNPGLRGAIDIGELQIVPGIAFPFTFSKGYQDNGFFFYVSFEHPY